MRELIGAKGTISLLKAAVPKKGPIKRPLTFNVLRKTGEYFFQKTAFTS
jgi:hypothetical protein